MVQLFKNGKSRKYIIHEYILTSSTLDKWIKDYDNAIAESTFKTMKAEFVYPNIFRTLDELIIQLSDYINWFNHHRIYGLLNYQTSAS